MEDNFSYEDALNRINFILETMENSDISLQENMKLFKEAKLLISKCDTYLKNMEKEFEVIIADTEDKESYQEDDIDETFR